ncbi:MAG: NAD(P)-binding domain-containing protein [Bacteroidales bacterium]|nr:NAD(P)-binding domain-containing protein [Bacteroidales bacterium]
MKEIVFVGSGAIATAIGNVLARKAVYNVTLLSIEEEVVESINEQRVNIAYFPNVKLSRNIKATTNIDVLKNAEVIFMAIPSTAVVGYLKNNKQYINPNAIIVNLAKGFGKDDRLIPECIMEFMSNPILTMKGPSFAREIINRQETGFTLASYNTEHFNEVAELFENTNIHFDFSTDMDGVEYASIMKNIYAIVIGLLDANYDSANMRSLIITKAINEMRSLLINFGGKDITMFNYCGFGDFSLTALNDMSRNRTLGLLIGKGFFNSGISEKVVLEGRIAVDVFYQKVQDSHIDINAYPLMSELYHVFNDNDYPTKKFIKNILNKIK